MPVATDPIRVFLVEDHCLVRAGFRQLLDTNADIQVVGEAASAEEAFGLVKEALPQVLVLDVSLPGISGIDALGRFLRLLPGLQVLMLSMHESDPFPELSLERGARGYLSKRCAPEELVIAVRQIAEGRHYLSSNIAQRLALERVTTDRFGLKALSPREFEIFTLLARGRSVREIAELVHLSPKTVHVHRANLLRKLGVRNPAELVQIAVRSGTLDLGETPGI
jgi:two-component system, NarL family, invasion response regulator UvrY